MHTELISASHPSALAHAVDVLNHGGMVVFPTDTVYGLAAMPFEASTVEQLYAAKGRSNEKAIAILLGAMAQLPVVTLNWGGMAEALAQRFWPGPLTLIVTKKPSLPESLSPNPTIGVRMPDHPVALALLRRAGPLAVTSANLSGQPSTTTAQETLAQLDGRVHLVLDGGKTPGGVPSTVVDCTGEAPVILRNGPVSLEALQQITERRKDKI